MRALTKMTLPLALCLSSTAAAQSSASAPSLDLPVNAPGMAELQAVSPALANYTENLVVGEVWDREGLSPRDRSVVTVAALISRNQSVEMPQHFRRALDNGVTASELSEIITHLAFYSGWPNAMSAVARQPNVAVKISGIGVPDSPWTVELNRHVVLETIDSFGVERCMFASNFPVDSLVASFTTLFDGFMTITKSFSETERLKLFHDNAVRFYHIDLPMAGT